MSEMTNVSEKKDYTEELYKQLSSEYHNLGDIRFTLLGLLPAVSVLAWIQLFKNEITSQPLAGLFTAVMGLVVSLGI